MADEHNIGLESTPDEGQGALSTGACDALRQISGTLGDSLAGPLSVTGDAGSVTMRSSRDLIDALNYLRGVCAVESGASGLRYTRLRPDATANMRCNRLRYPRWRDCGC